MLLKHAFYAYFGCMRKYTSLTTISTSQPWMSLDHTFRSVSNIGLVRSADKRWIRQYSGLLNSDGEVLTWKMTKSLSFDDMVDMLLVLRDRLVRQGKQVKEFFIDNCCSFRHKLQSVFGAQLLTYFMLFRQNT